MNPFSINPRYFTDKLLTLRQNFLFSITSYYRTPKHNAAVGGKALSQHLYGLAADVVLDPGEDHLAFLQAAKVLELSVVVESTWIHLQALPYGTPVVPPPFFLSRPVRLPLGKIVSGSGMDRQGEAKPATAPEGGLAQGGVPLAETV